MRQWVNRQARPSNIHRGKEILRKELRRLNLNFTDEELLSLVKYNTMDDFLAKLGSGGITEGQVAYRLSQSDAEPEPPRPSCPF